MVWRPEHPKSISTGSYKGYVYEHTLIAEANIGRKLKPSEEVHHLNFVRADNRPKNLLVLLSSEHARLHSWLRREGLDREEEQANYGSLKKALSMCPRCSVCQWPLDSKKENRTCSLKCLTKKRRDLDSSRAEELKVLIDQRTPWVTIGKTLAMSGVGAKNLAHRLGLI